MNQVSADESDPSISVDTKRVNKAIAYASRLLGSREYSPKVMLDKILDKGYERAEASQAIDFLIENNWLSELRFAESFVRGKVARGQGLSRIRYELQQKGVSSQLCEKVLEEQDIQWQQVCDRVTKKKLNAASICNDLKGRQKLERFLRYRGFSGAETRRSIDKYINCMGETLGEHDE